MRVSIKALLAPSLLLLSWGCSADSSSRDEQDLTEDVGVERAGLRKGTPGARVGDGNYCDNPAAPCSAGEGDCDGSGSCEAGLVCSSGKLKQFGFPGGDACVPAHCANKLRDADETQIDCGGSCGTVCATPVCRPNGTNGRCNSDCLCQAGEGDCDSSSECAAGLLCGGKLSQFGFSSGNACVAPHCLNKLRDADETQIDCGGSCGTVCPNPACRPNGTNGRCNSDCLCQAGEGDCDSSTQCAAGLVCGGKLSQFGFSAGNACVAPHCLNKVRDGNETQVDCGGDCGSVGCEDGGGGGGTGGLGGSGGGGTGGGGTAGGGGGGGESCDKLCVSVLERCVSNDDCPIDQYCDGSCHPAAGLHETCSLGNRCGHEQARQLYCAPASRTCELPLRTNDECEFSAIPCEQPDTCVRGKLDDTLRCRPPVRKDDYCSFNTNCEPGTFCDEFSPLFDRLCLPFVEENGSCTPKYPCAPGLYCSASRICVRSPGASQACLSPALCLPNSSCSLCAQDLYCDAGTCRPHASAGQDCTAQACAGGLRCLSRDPCDPQDCGSGYTFSDGVCIDIDECATHRDNCSVNAVCTNISGGFTCSCKRGYAGNGLVCTDVDECAGSPCPERETCVNLPGSYSCTCDAPSQRCGSACVNVTSDVWNCGACGVACAQNQMCVNSACARGGGVVAAGSYHTCATRTNGTVACWGYNGGGQATPPTGTFTAISAGYQHTCGLRTDATLSCWGWNGSGEASPPAGAFLAVSVGESFSCGLRSDGTLACWGDNSYYDWAVPPGGTFVALSSGPFHSCAVRTDGTVACWGDNYSGKATPPSGSFIAVSASGHYTCGIRTNGTLVCWGDNSLGQAAPPTGTFSTVSGGGGHTCGVRTDGTLACWGDNSSGQATPPTGTFSTVSAGGYHTCGVRTDTTVVCWGDNTYGQSTAP